MPDFGLSVACVSMEGIIEKDKTYYPLHATACYRKAGI